MEDDRYPNIAGHGLTGDLRTAALVTGIPDFQLDHGAGLVEVLAGR